MYVERVLALYPQTLSNSHSLIPSTLLTLFLLLLLSSSSCSTHAPTCLQWCMEDRVRCNWILCYTNGHTVLCVVRVLSQWLWQRARRQSLLLNWHHLLQYNIWVGSEYVRTSKSQVLMAYDDGNSQSCCLRNNFLSSRITYIVSFVFVPTVQCSVQCLLS